MAIEPVPESSVSTVVERSQEDRERWWKMGLKAIFDGKLAVLLLSGGQVYFNLFLMNIYIFFLILGQPVRDRRHVWLGLCTTTTNKVFYIGYSSHFTSVFNRRCSGRRKKRKPFLRRS